MFSTLLGLSIPSKIGQIKPLELAHAFLRESFQSQEANEDEGTSAFSIGQSPLKLDLPPLKRSRENQTPFNTRMPTPHLLQLFEILPI